MRCVAISFRQSHKLRVTISQSYVIMVCNPTHAQGLHIWFILHKTKRDKTKIKKGEREDDAGHLIHVYMTASDAIVSLPIFIIKG